MQREPTMIRGTGIAVLFACALAVGLPAQAQEKPRGVALTAAELKALVEPSLLIAGRHVLTFQAAFADLFVAGGASYSVYTGSTGAGGPSKGKWRLEGDTFCRKHELAGEHCVRFYRLADGSYEAWTLEGDKLVSTFKAINK